MVAPIRKPLGLIHAQQSFVYVRQLLTCRIEHWIEFFNSIVSKYHPQRVQVDRLLQYLQLPEAQERGSSVIANSFTTQLTVNRLLLPAVIFNQYVCSAEKQHKLSSYYTNSFTNFVTMNHLSVAVSAPALSRNLGNARRISQLPLTNVVQTLLSRAKQNQLNAQRDPEAPALVFSNIKEEDMSALQNMPLVQSGSLVRVPVSKRAHMSNADNTRSASSKASHEIYSAQTDDMYEPAFSVPLKNDKQQSSMGANARIGAHLLVSGKNRQTYDRTYNLHTFSGNKDAWYPVTDGNKSELVRVKTMPPRAAQRVYLHHKHIATCSDINNRKGLGNTISLGRVLPASPRSILLHSQAHNREETDKNLVHLSGYQRTGMETMNSVREIKKGNQKSNVVDTYTVSTAHSESIHDMTAGGEVQVSKIANQVYDLIVERVRRERLLRGH